MNRTQRLKMNSIVSLLTRLIIIISGLILPRLILSNFGAETHGLVNSVNQFLGVITFLDLGVGSVVKSALYRPLAKKDSNQVSSILIAAKSYFKKIAYILVAYIIVLILFYPLLIDSSYSYLSTGILIIALSISKFGQYYFGIVNELLLSANQQDYIQLGSEIVVVILNLFISIFLIYIGASIQIVKLGSGLIFLLRPLYLSLYVKKNFTLNYDIKVKKDPLPQKWHGMGQHIAYSIQSNTDVVVLTFFSTLESISVYAIYNMVVSAIKLIVSSLTTGIQSFYGDLYANNEIKLLNNYFDRIEWIVHTGVTFLFGVTAVLIQSFVRIYTMGVEDVSYEAPLFSLLLVLGGASFSLRSPYQSLIFSAGHFKQTQRSSFIEAGLNLILSIILVNEYGLVGVAIGTLVSMTYRTIYLVIYLSKNIVFRSVKKFMKHIFVDILSFGMIMIVGILISNLYTIETIVDWIIVAVIIVIVSINLVSIINLVFFKDIMILAIRRLKRKN